MVLSTSFQSAVLALPGIGYIRFRVGQNRASCRQVWRVEIPDPVDLGWLDEQLAALADTHPTAGWIEVLEHGHTTAMVWQAVDLTLASDALTDPGAVPTSDLVRLAWGYYTMSRDMLRIIAAGHRQSLDLVAEREQHRTAAVVAASRPSALETLVSAFPGAVSMAGGMAPQAGQPTTAQDVIRGFLSLPPDQRAVVLEAGASALAGDISGSDDSSRTTVE